MAKKSKKSAKEKIASILLILLCLAGSGVCLGFFASDFFRTLRKLDEKPIAEIASKHKTAQRKFLNSDSWDKLRQSSPLYNGDTVRTAPSSEATISFNEDDSIEVLENSTVQIFLEDGETVIDVIDGGVIVKAGKDSKGFKVKVGGVSTTIEGGTSLSAIKDGDSLITNLQVLDGKAVLDSGEVLEKGNFFFDKGKQIKNIPSITVHSPYPNEKILNLTGGKVPVEFRWSTQNLSSDNSIVLEISNYRDFQNAKEYELKNTANGKMTAELEGSTNYWRIYPSKSGKKYQTKGKVTLVEGKRQNLIIPVADYQETFRSELPSVRFMWEENEWASGYFLEISSSPNFSSSEVEFITVENFAIISSLEEGIWYWRVTPEFKSGTVRNKKLTSETRSFEIIKETNIEKPRLIAPLKDSTVAASEKEPLVFSWKSGEDGDTYNIKISKDPDFTDCIVDAETSENNFSAEIPEEGDYFWKVTVRDKNGKERASDPREFSVRFGDSAQKLIFPPDGYSVEADRLKDVCFVWKTSEADKPFTQMQLSETDGFNKIIKTIGTGKNEATIESLELGTYYWRIRTDKESEESISESRSFTVMEKLKAPDTVYPRGNIKIGIDKDNPVHFEWEPVEKADSYKFRLYKADDTTTPVYEKNNVAQSGVDVDMSKLGDGDYIWTVQANAAEKDDSTRFSGELSQHEFSARTVKRAKLLSPAEKSFVDGTKNYISGTDFRWSSEEATKNVVLKIFKDGKLVREIKNPKNKVNVRNLEAGNYTWTLSAEAQSDGLDISPAKPVKFAIEKFKALGKPVLSAPKDKTNYSAKELKSTDSILFSWSAVKDANVYVIIIKDSGGRTILSQNVGNVTEYTFKSLTSLSRGKFTWQIEARQVSKKETIRTSSSSEFEFVIDIPVLETIKLEDAGELYGF